MKKLTLFVENDFLDILQDFKKNVLKDMSISDEKSMILITRYFMEFFNKNKDND